MKAVVVSVGIQKGGTGKTTTVVNLAHALGTMDKRVLVVDADPQGNASTTLGKVPPFDQPRSMGDLFTEDEVVFGSCAVPSKYPNVDLIVSHIDLFALQNELVGTPQGMLTFQRKLDDRALSSYDFILIDLAPALTGPFFFNSLAVSDFYVIPIEGESYYALKGVADFRKSVNAIRSTLNPKLEFLGTLVTMTDFRTTTTRAMVESIRMFFGEDRVFKATITRTTGINKATLAKKTAIDFDPSQIGAKDYEAFAREFLEWVEERRRSNT